MVLIGLLLVALVCLVLGLVLASGPWLIGSLVGQRRRGAMLLFGSANSCCRRARPGCAEDDRRARPNAGSGAAAARSRS